MWKLVYQSLRGTSHRRSGRPCQDRCKAEVVRSRGEQVLVLACADGAGSADLSAIGAKLACRTIIRMILSALQRRLAVEQIDQQVMTDWYGLTRTVLEQEARGRGQAPRQFAATLLLAVVGETAARFAQIGDGAIVVQDDGGYRPVFWPKSHEYVNATNFLTDGDWKGATAFAGRDSRLDELALLTDGLQPLCLDYTAKAAYRPFFSPMFCPLREANSGSDLLTDLRQFLDSPQVNERTDDDKTLILATRVPSGGQNSQTLR